MWVKVGVTDPDAVGGCSPYSDGAIHRSQE